VQGGTVDLIQRSNPLLSKKDKKKVDIRLIGLDGIVGKAFFSDQIADEERSCGYKLRGNGFSGEGQMMCCRLLRQERIKRLGRERLQALLVSVVSLRPSCAVEFPKLSAGLGLFPSFHDAGFFVAFTTFQLSFDAIDLQLFLQLSDGVFNVSTNFNFYHLGLQYI
jgi:hypothetical protein